LKQQLANVASGEDLEDINDSLNDVNQDLEDLLNSSNVFTGNLVINILTFEDLRKIGTVEMPKHLDNARRWLLIGFWIGQRVPDLLTLEPFKLRDAPNGGLYVDIHQQKIGKKITVGVIDPTA